MPVATVFVVATIYGLALFLIAYWAKSGGFADIFSKSKIRPIAYSMALAVYCTSWTLFGAVGTAVVEGWNYLPIYLGPILLFIFGFRFLEKLVEAVKSEGATSISHFIGTRYSNSRGVAALVTIIALLGIIPYIALQIRSVGTSFTRLTAFDDTFLPMALTAVVLTVFSILFGARTYQASNKNDGILLAIAVESLVKILALLAVGVFATLAFLHAPEVNRDYGLSRMVANFSPSRINIDFFVYGFLASIAIICLPRQFYVAAIQANEANDIVRARIPFTGYLVLTTLIALPIALASFTILPTGFRADLLVIDLPLSLGNNYIGLLVFIGGFSAATGMVIVETIALSTMISNDLIAPILLRNEKWSRNINFGKTMLIIRRSSIIFIMIIAFFYARVVPQTERLASIGFVAFAAVAQFAPALVFSVFGSNRNPDGVKAGLLAGLIVWSYTLFLPLILPANVLEMMDGTFFDPDKLFGIGTLSNITHGALWSLGANICVHTFVSARRFRAPRISIDFGNKVQIANVATKQDLINLVGRFIGEESAVEALGDKENLVSFSGPIDRITARNAERLIAGVIGAPSARALMASALSGSSLSLNEVAQMLDSSGQSLQFSKDLLASTLENIDPGVSVIDNNLKLVAWNSRYLDLFNYPPSLIKVGTPVAELIRYNAMNGECGPGDVENHVERRMANLRRRTRHSFERLRPDGRVFKTVGGPMPSGGYVMCFTDITAEANARSALEKSREELEERVQQRTIELSEATIDKTRFLAAASHDLLQPLHAARLFASALSRQVEDDKKQLLAKLDKSIESGETLLRRLLEVSKLDAGGIVPVPIIFSARTALLEVSELFRQELDERKLKLIVAKNDAIIDTDPVLFRSIVQNLVSNAVRYTKKGGILIGVRKRGAKALIEVYDTGPGVHLHQQKVIFNEFERIGVNDEVGLGLGLSIVQRTAKLLGGEIRLRSEWGKGSRFSFLLPLKIQTINDENESFNSAPQQSKLNTKALSDGTASAKAKSAKFLVVDDDAGVRDGMLELLSSLGFTALAANSYEEAFGAFSQDPHKFDAFLLDYDLCSQKDGVDLAIAIIAIKPSAKIAIITAHELSEFAERIKDTSITTLRKPIAPKLLFDWIENQEIGI